LDKLDPALGYYDGELRFWLGWRKKSPAIMPPLRKVGARRAANWNLFSKGSRENFIVIGDLCAD
jgi:hypothetical protein